MATHKFESSTMIKEIRYHDDSTTMYVQFHNDKVYRYPKVDKYTYIVFTTAESAGSFFNREIKNRYPSTRLPKGFPKATQETE